MPRKSANHDTLGHIVVVEDDSVLALSIEATLLDGGAKSVTLCASTSEAMEALRQRKPDVLILDVHLADRDDGWALAELVSAVGPRPPRIIFSTGSPQDIPPEIAEMGTMLEKPYDPADLLALARPERQRGLLSRLRS